MARIARIIAPDYAHLVTQQGNRGQRTFFNDDDYIAYIDLMSEFCSLFNVEIWAYCLMPTHVHMIAVPETEDGLRRAVGEAHRRYTNRINLREDWRGHLWQGRFSSFVMDEAYMLKAAMYVERNPVRAGLVKNPADYRWSSAPAHLDGENDALVRIKPLLDLAGDWKKFLQVELTETELETLRRHERTGRVLGSPEFIAMIADLLDRDLIPKKPGRKKKRFK